jgi:gliding motility-associated-like protein
LTSTVTSVNYSSGEMIINNDITVADTDNTDIESATVSILSGFTTTEDILSFTSGTGITGSYDASVGVLSLSGSASLANYEIALRSVTYQNTNTDDRNTTPRSIVFQVNDGTEDSNTLETTIQLSGEGLLVFNAVSANDDNLNAFFNLLNISPENQVTIYNRWGDKVFEMKNYDNTKKEKRFEGVNNDGDELPSGTYFYKIEHAQGLATGYLSLKR